MKSKLIPFLAWLLSLTVVGASAHALDGDVTIGDLCRIKGQEENTLMGYGLVVGLKGTGDGDSAATTRALARSLQLLGGQIGVDQKGLLQSQELKDAKNVAAVIVTTTIPAGGAQQGDRLKCTVSALSAKSLEGGTLILTPMLGPRPDRQIIYALANGQLDIPDPKYPTQAIIQAGVKMEANVINEFIAGDKFTLIIDADHSSFKLAQDIATEINADPGLTGMSKSPGDRNDRTSIGEKLAVAKGQMHVEVRIPTWHAQEPQFFIEQVLSHSMTTRSNSKRVVIQERQGIVIIGEDVTISPCAINHQNLMISTKGNTTGTNGFVGLTEGKIEKRPKLQSLVDSLNVLSVPTKDVIAIIKALKRNGALYGELVVE